MNMGSTFMQNTIFVFKNYQNFFMLQGDFEEDKNGKYFV